MYGIQALQPQYATRPMRFAEGGMATPSDVQAGIGSMAPPAGAMPPMPSEPPMAAATMPAPSQLESVIQQVEQTLSPDLVESFRSLVAELSALPPDQIQKLIQVIDFLSQNADNYAQAVDQLVSQGVVKQGDLPATYNPALFDALKEVLKVAASTPAQPSGIEAAGMAPPTDMMPTTMARGGIVDSATGGRFGDTMLAHINAREAAMLSAMGGMGSYNPRTGAREYFDLGDVLKVAAPVIGAIAGSFLPLAPIVGAAAASFIGPAVGSFAASKLAGYDTKQALINGVVAGGFGYGAGYTQAAQYGGYGAEGGPSLGSAVMKGVGDQGVGSLFKFGQVAPTTTAPSVAPQAAGAPAAAAPTTAAAAQTTAAPAANLAKVSPAEFAKLPLEQQNALLQSQKNLAEYQKLSGGEGMFGSIGNFVKDNPFMVAAGISALSMLDQPDQPKPLGYEKTSEQLIQENPNKYMFNPSSFGIRSMQAKAGGAINGPGTGTSDSIPARLSDGEFVMTAKAVRGAGDGDRRAGAAKMYRLMHQFEKLA